MYIPVFLCVYMVTHTYLFIIKTDTLFVIIYMKIQRLILSSSFCAPV